MRPYTRTNTYTYIHTHERTHTYTCTHVHTRVRTHLHTRAHFPPPRKHAQVNEGVVLAVGPGRRTKDGDLLPPSVKEGDKVLLPEYGGSLVKLNDKE